MSDSPLTYTSYLRLDELLSQQVPLSDGPEHDELLFIVIHQVYELWFKQILHELDEAMAALDRQDRHAVSAALKRVLTILKTLVGQVDILETMTPISFASFRSRLASSSGFQSAQFREVEFVLGVKHTRALVHHPEQTPARARLEARLAAPSLWLRFLGFLSREGFAIPQADLDRDPAEATVASEGVQDVLVGLYRAQHDLTGLCELLVDLDEGLQEWRYRHVKMVERTIGTKPGTGGSAGVAYLKRSLFSAAFPDLWEIRSAF